MIHTFKSRGIEFVGWLAVAAFLLAFALVSFGYVQGESYVFQGLNVVGALGTIIHSYSKKDYQPVALNVVWLVIACVVIVRLLVL